MHVQHVQSEVIAVAWLLAENHPAILSEKPSWLDWIPTSTSAKDTVPKSGMKMIFPNVLTPGIGIGPMLFTSEHSSLG